MYYFKVTFYKIVGDSLIRLFSYDSSLGHAKGKVKVIHTQFDHEESFLYKIETLFCEVIE